MNVRLLLAAALLAPAALQAQQRYGFLARLGVDTISVESVTRWPDHLVSDQVERFPRVIRRHTEIRFGPDKRIRQLIQDITLPTATTPKWKSRRFTADYLGDSVRITVRNGEGSSSLMLATGGATTLPWTAHQYSLSELFLDQAPRTLGDSLFLRLYYVDMQIEDFGSLPKGLIPGGYVRRLSGGRVEVFHHDGLAGAGEGAFDADGRMLAYSGARSTYKVEVTRTTTPPDVDAVAAAFTALEKQNGVPAGLSLRDTTRATIGTAQLLVDYGRPLVRGRTLLGAVIPFGQVWRTGANAATQFSTSAPIRVGGRTLPAGIYSLWTRPDPNGVILLVNGQHGQWGTQYDASRDLDSIPLARETRAGSAEKFTISIVPVDRHHGTLVFEWGTFRWVVGMETED
ncbi:MAG: DUF2911 domain-containing protein [Gemmatimonadota bacterium]